MATPTKTALPAWVEVIDVDDEDAAVEVKTEVQQPLVVKTEEPTAVVDVKTEAVVHASSSALADTEVAIEPSPATPAPEVLPPPEAPANKVMIMGYNVDFPMGKKPFPAQLAVMNKVLLSLKTSQHALLESPTGSGKTLALLCSSLTFQRQHAAELLATHEAQRKIAKEAHAQKMKALMDKVHQAEAAAALQQQYGSAEASGIASVKAERIDDDDFASSQPSFDRFRFQGPKSVATGSGWISMESKKSAVKMESEANDDFDSNVILLSTVNATTERKNKRVLLASFAGINKSNIDGGSEDDDNMESPPELKKLKTEKRMLPSSFAAAGVAASTSMESISHESFHATSSSSDAADASTTSTTSRLMPPKIFFCSRTHSQLSQVVDELKNCPVSYMQNPDATNPFTSELKMCVLGSKSHFCINKKANKDPGEVDDKCRQLLDVNACTYASKRRNTNDLRRLAPPVWDIEDLVALGKRHRECAFFHARDVLVDANIVFCPYNYVLDPSIRSAVSISLKNAIIIFDEAHNVEDTCRSSASMELNTEVLALAIKAFTTVIKNGNRPPTYHSLLKLLNGLNRWLQTINKHPNTMLQPTGFEEESKVWSGAECIAMFAEYTGMTPETFKQIKADLAAVSELEKELSSASSESQSSQSSKSAGRGGEDGNQEDALLLGTLALSTVQTVLHVADYMFRGELKYLDDFKLVVRKSRVNRNSGGRFRGAYDMKAGGDGWELKMCIWCLNAAVAFSDVVKQCRSVILTSGTLSPMDSFAGELGTDFPIRLEANHVVNMRKQVFAGAIMNGPGRVDLSATFKNQQEFRYQDSMGQLLLQYVNVIPGGVLMFFPSYSLMDKLVARWQQTGVWAEVDAVKTMFSEPRKAGKDFDALLDDYKYEVANAGAGRSGTKTGAVFLAVYRGKVSEGIDFSNDNARAVLCVGIPFPNVKELQVSLKRQYQNEKSQVDKKLVNGAVWYQLQAFRALNQALGRCIRHRKDYGAILLIDSRHRFQAHTKSLSKWLRPFIQEIEDSRLCLPYFSEFFERNALEFRTEAAITAAPTPVEPSPMVLKYENASNTPVHRAPPATLESSMNSVKARANQKETKKL
ncbi:Fanconi anemia group j, partial [Globisporangium splendens]